MAFSVDHDKAAKGRYLAPEGEYETVIRSARQNVTRDGVRFLDFRLFIREDVTQPGQGETICYAAWRKKLPGEFDPEGFPAGVIHNLCRCAGIANGVRFESLDECLRCMTGLCIRVRVKHEEANGVKKARVSFVLPPEIPYAAEAMAVSEELPF